MSSEILRQRELNKVSTVRSRRSSYSGFSQRAQGAAPDQHQEVEKYIKMLKQLQVDYDKQEWLLDEYALGITLQKKENERLNQRIELLREELAQEADKALEWRREASRLQSELQTNQKFQSPIETMNTGIEARQKLKQLEK